jgi:hypothetical protein
MSTTLGAHLIINSPEAVELLRRAHVAHESAAFSTVLSEVQASLMVSAELADHVAERLHAAGAEDGSDGSLGFEGYAATYVLLPTVEMPDRNERWSLVMTARPDSDLLISELVLDALVEEDDEPHDPNEGQLPPALLRTFFAHGVFLADAAAMLGQ